MPRENAKPTPGSERPMPRPASTTRARTAGTRGRLTVPLLVAATLVSPLIPFVLLPRTASPAEARPRPEDAAANVVYRAFAAHGEGDMLRFFAAFGEPIRIDGFPQANIRDVWPLIQRQTVAIELNAVQATEHEVQFAFLSHCALKTPLPTTGLMTVRRRGFAWKIVAIEPRG